MVGGRSRSRWAIVAIGVGALLLLVLAGNLLFAGDSAGDPCKPPSPAPRSERAAMPAGLTFEGIGTVTRVRKVERHFVVQAISSKPLDELAVQIQDAVVAAGYEPAGMDNEGFEAEVFFNSGRYAGGQARLRQSFCEGRWDIDLVLLDRAAVVGGA